MLPFETLGVIPWYTQFQFPEKPICGHFAIRGFGLMVVSAILVGYQILIRRARMWKLEDDDVADFVFWTVAIGFVGSHVVEVLFYHPEKLKTQGIIALFKVWDGISSLGGWISGLLAAWAFFRIRQLRPWRFVDSLGFAWPFAWLLARGGCALAHDHPGTRSASSFPLAIDFPPGYMGPLDPGGPRHDLGLYEMLFMIIPCLLFVGVRAYEKRREHPFAPGFYLGLMLVVYAPVRFFLDFFRIADKRYLVDLFPLGGLWSDPVVPTLYLSSGMIRGLTPAHFMSILVLLAGIWILTARPGQGELDAWIEAEQQRKAKEGGKAAKAAKKEAAK